MKFAIRSLLRTPGFTLVVILTLALGIGANTAIFSLMDKVLWEMLPVERPRELVVVDHDGPRAGQVLGGQTWSYPAYVAFRDRQQSFSGLIAHRSFPVNFAAGGAAERAAADVVTGNYFEVLGIRPAIGRLLMPSDDVTPGGHPVAVLAHSFWMNRFGGSTEVLNQKVLINGNPFTIIGVAEKGFNGLQVGGVVDVFTTTMMKPQITPLWSGLDRRNSYWLHIYGRLKPGVSRQEAIAQLTPLYAEQMNEDLAALGPAFTSRFRDFKWQPGKLQLLDGHRGLSSLRNQLQTPFFALLAMVSLVLLIACANVAGLMLTRAASRRKEVAVRLALGASRWMIARQLLVESTILALAGGLAGLILATWTVDLVAAGSDDLSRIAAAMNVIDGPVLLFAGLLSVITGIAFGLAPALQASRTEVAPDLKGETLGASSANARFRKGLVTAQIALSILLLTGAGLFLRTLHNLRYANPGFRAEHLIQFSIDARLGGHDRTSAVQLYTGILDSLKTLPGVRSASLAKFPLLGNSITSFTVKAEGYDPAPNEPQSSNWNSVGPGFFRTAGLPLAAGREFEERDGIDSPKVAVVNEAFARHYFRGRNPIGRHIEMGWAIDRQHLWEIVGVVQDAKQATLREKTREFFYIPCSQDFALSDVTFYVRSDVDSNTLAGEIRRIVQRHDAGLPIVGYRTIEQQIDRLVRPERMLAQLSSAFGILAAMLAAIGLYGVMASIVTRRTREIGIRIALGAEKGNILWLVLREIAGLTAIGIVAGITLALVLGRFVESQLFGVPARDWLTLTAAVVGLAAVAFVAGYLPARRAVSIDPISALRYE